MKHETKITASVECRTSGHWNLKEEIATNRKLEILYYISVEIIRTIFNAKPKAS